MIIRVAILEDHRSVIDGYLYRLSRYPDIAVVATATYGEELEPMMQVHPIDVLLLDVQVWVSENNSAPYPIMHQIPHLLARYPNLAILVITMFNVSALIRGIIDVGASGYIVKDDTAAIETLGEIIRKVARGDVHFSEKAHAKLVRSLNKGQEPKLTARQLEVLSFFGAHPNSTTLDIATELSIAPSTVRNTLSNSYFKLGVRNRTAALAKARELGLITPNTPPPHI